MTAPRRRMIVKELCEEFHVSQRRASRRWTWPGPAFATRRSFAMSRWRWLDASRNWPGPDRGSATGGSGPCWIARAGRSTRRPCVRLYRELGLKVAQPRANPKLRRAHGQDENACHLRPAAGKTTYGHGTLSSTVPVTVEVSNG